MMKKYYRLELHHPDVRKEYDRYKAERGIPFWCPLSDSERRDFEEKYIEKRKIP